MCTALQIHAYIGKAAGRKKSIFDKEIRVWRLRYLSPDLPVLFVKVFGKNRLECIGYRKI